MKPFIDYDPTNESGSVLFHHDLKTAIDQAYLDANGNPWDTVTITGGGTPLDVTSEGTKAVDGGYNFVGWNLANIDDTAFQISFDIERDGATYDGDSLILQPDGNGSFGYNGVPTMGYVTSISGTGSSFNSWARRRTQGLIPNFLGKFVNTSFRDFQADGEGLGDHRINSIGKGSIVRISLGMDGPPRAIGTRLFCAYDGYPIATAITTGSLTATALLNRFFLCSAAGGNSEYNTEYRISNFQIVQESVEFGGAQKSGLLGMLSDSLCPAEDINDNNGFDSWWNFSLQRKMFNIEEMNLPRPYNDFHGGSGFLNAGNGGGNLFITRCPALLSAGCTEAALCGGTNDIGQTTSKQVFKDAAIEVLDFLLGVNGETATDVTRVSFMTPPPRNSNFGDATATQAATWIREAMFELEAEYNADFGDGTVLVADVHKAFTDAGYTDENWTSALSPEVTSDGTHYTSSSFVGETLYDTLYAAQAQGLALTRNYIGISIGI